MNQQPWYVEYFGEDYLRMHAPVLSPERSEQETSLILERLALPAGSRILDLCCGHGRHSVRLASLGYEVTGLDLSEVLLAAAQAEAEKAGVTVRWVHSDMREIPFEAEFDAVINIFSAFAYLESETEDQKVLEQVFQALKPGGLFLMEIMHRDGIVRRLEPCSITRHPDGLIVLEERQIDLLTSRGEIRVTMIEAGRPHTEYRLFLRLYSLTELAGMLQAAGLSLIGYFGGLDGSELTLDSRQMVLLARKPVGA